MFIETGYEHHLSMFGLLDDRCRRHGRLHSPRAARMAEKSPSTPIASSVQTKKKCPLELASLLVTPTPFPFMWMIGTTNEKSDPRSRMTHPDRRSASTNVAYSQTTVMSTPPTRL